MGLFADTGVSTVGQLSIGGKSPLTGGVKESNSGGFAGRRIARLGIKAIMLEDLPEKEETRVLFVSKSEAKLIGMPELRHKRVSETFLMLKDNFGEKRGLICIGPAGEMKMHGAGVASVDDKHVQVRYAGRGGLGAVMGSKGVKAIVIDDAGADPAEHYDPSMLADLRKKIDGS